MSQEDLIKRSLTATIKGTTAGGALSTAAAVGYIKGCTAVRSSTGVVAITRDPSASFDPQVTAAEAGYSVTIFSTNTIYQLVETSSTVVTLNLFSATIPTTPVEAAFEVDLYRIFPS